MRIMAVFEKGERLRHIGHLDIVRSMQRALRRSALPAAYSNGFNPHILLSFASALSVGAVGENELMEVVLTEEVQPDRFQKEMNMALPPGMQIRAAKVIPEKSPSLMTRVQAAEYKMFIHDEEAFSLLFNSIPNFLAQTSIPSIRKTKSGEKECDIRPWIKVMDSDGESIHVITALTEQENCKTDMLISALAAFTDIEFPRYLAIRKHLMAYDERSESYQPLENLV